MVFVRGLTSQSLNVHTGTDAEVKVFRNLVEERTAVPHSNWRLTFSGKPLEDGKQLQDYGIQADSTVHLTCRLLGGKGGFGSLLRGAGRAILTDNVDACRDLSGRRLRQANAEKRLAEWAAQARERELEKVALKHVREQEKANKREQRAQIDSEAIKREQQEALARVAAAVIAAQEILAGGTLESGKRKASLQVTDKPAKRARIFGLDPDIASGTDSEDDEEIALMEKAGQLAAAESSGWDSSVSDQETAHHLGQPSSSASAAAPHQPQGLAQGSSAPAPQFEGTSQHPASDASEAVATDAATASANPATLSQHQVDAVRSSVALQPGSSAPATGSAPQPASALAKQVQTQQTAPPSKSAATTPEEPSVEPSIRQVDQLAQSNQAAAAAVVPVATETTQQEVAPLDLADFATAADLEKEGMDRLKGELQRHGLKCGGTLAQRAARLFLLKDKSIKEIDRKQFAKQ